MTTTPLLMIFLVLVGSKRSQNAALISPGSANSEKRRATAASASRKLRRRTIIGFGMLVIGLLLYGTFPGLVNDLLKSELQVKEGNEFTKAWNKNPFPAELKVHIFDITNPDEFANGAKPVLREMGPYAYDLWLYKDIISFNEDQTRVKYWEAQSFDVRPATQSRLSDKVRVLNFPVYAMANLVRDMAGNMPFGTLLTPAAMGFVNLVFLTHGEGLIKELTVGEMLNGYKFGILETIETMTTPLAWFGIKMPDTGMPDNKFGFLWTQNYTRNGPLEATTGQHGTPLLNVVKFKEESSLPFYEGSDCNEIKGTEGTTLGVDTQKDMHYVFTAATCRTFNLVFQKDTWVNGIPTYRFTPNPSLFRSPSKTPINKCYCHTPDNEAMCDGIFDLSRCLGAPVAYSWPHFYDTSLQLQSSVGGLSPSQEKHQAFIDVEPFMGAPIRGYEKLQSNAIIKPVPYLAGFRNFPPTVLPLMWLQKGAVINDEYTWKFRMALYPLYAIFFLIYMLIGGGLLMLVSVGTSFYRKGSQVDDQSSQQQQQQQQPPQPQPAATQQPTSEIKS